MSQPSHSSDMPVYLVEYDDRWLDRFAAESDQIQRVLSVQSVEVEHIGSTAIPGMAAKPIIDIMVLIGDIEMSAECFEPLKMLEYHYYPYGEDIFPERRWFCKPNQTDRTHHLHLVERDTAFHRDHLLFRNYLRAHVDAARRYETLKRQLANRYRDDRDRYTDGKSAFVASILSKARAEVSRPWLT